MLSYKKLIGMTAIVLTAAFASYYLLKSQTPKFKVYKDENFQVTYPADYSVIRAPVANGYAVFIYKGNNPDPQHPGALCNKFSIEINVNSDGFCGSAAFMGRTTNIVTTQVKLAGQTVTKSDDYIKEYKEAVQISYDDLKFNSKFGSVLIWLDPRDQVNYERNKQLFESIVNTLQLTQAN
ncbi:MAG TPA: hypothetical protein VLI92_02250 [Candidatus Saccharimonadales bacterium]|nr:hypothetical protein [Candidatus Saccharimonadales bacterium]